MGQRPVHYVGEVVTWFLIRNFHSSMLNSLPMIVLKCLKQKLNSFLTPFPRPPPMKHLVLFDLIIFCDIVKMLFLICNNDISFPAKMVYNNIAEWVDLFFPYLPLSATIHEGWSVTTILYIEQSCQYYFKFNAHISSVCEKMIKKDIYCWTHRDLYLLLYSQYATTY